jgi:hypothetical protein
MKDLKHIKRFNEAQENLNISDVSGSELTDDDFLFRLFYFTGGHSEIKYQINYLLGEDTGNVMIDWENSSINTKQQIINIIKSYVLTLS